MSPAPWLDVLGWAALAVGFASAAAIGLDRLRRGGRFGVMDVVHPVTALYLGPAWLPVYRGGGHAQQSSARRQVALAVSHCGAGCTLGDICGEWLLFAVFGSPALGAAGSYGWEIVADLVFAWSFGIAFQYVTIEPGEGSRLARIGRAIKVDTLSILAFEVGLFGWMALAHFVLVQPPLAVDTSAHWFSMQIGMALGFATAWPMNALLIRRGVKTTMHG